MGNPRKRVKEVVIRSYASVMDRMVHVTVQSFNAWGDLVGDVERTISVQDLAEHVFGDELPRVGDVVSHD